MLKPAKSLVWWTVIVLLLTMAVEIAIPLFSQVFVDSIITNKHPEWQEPMVILLAIVVLVSFASVLFGVSFKRRVTLKYYINVATRTFWHFLRLPVEVLSRYSPGNLVSRIKSGYSTAQNLSIKLLPSFIVVIQIAVMLILMLFYSPVLSLVSLFSVVINVISLRMVSQKQKNISQAMEESNSGLQSLVMSGISNIETVKAAGAEGAFFRKAMNAFGHFINSNNNLSVSLVKLNFLPAFLQQITSMLSLCLGVIFIIKGEMTVGSLMAFQGFLVQFLRPVTLLTRTNQLLLSASTSTERLLEILDYPADVPSEIVLPEKELIGKLKGRIQINNVTFGYDRNLPPLIENLSLTIEPGKSVALVGGSGSGNVNRKYKVSLNEGLVNAGLQLEDELAETYRTYTAAELAKMPAENFWTIPVAPEMLLTKEQVKSAIKNADVAVLTISRMAGEGGDRKAVKGDWLLSDTEEANLRLVCQEAHAAKKKAILILNMGNIIDLTAVHNLPDAILHAWMGGQEMGNSIADVLTGKVNPSGKLPMTWALKYEDYSSANNFPESDGNAAYARYEEDVMVGYRHFDTQKVKTLYPFGYGLSYTTFAYSDMKISVEGDHAVVEVKVKNTGDAAGREIVQLYVGKPAVEGLLMPAKELVNFKKTAELQPGEETIVKMQVKAEDVAYFNEQQNTWIVAKGKYTAYVAASAEDIRLQQSVEL